MRSVFINLIHQFLEIILDVCKKFDIKHKRYNHYGTVLRCFGKVGNKSNGLRQDLILSQEKFECKENICCVTAIRN